MRIGERLRALREGRNLSQNDIAKKTGLLRCNISRAENGHTVPSVETLEKFAWALEVPLYQLFYAGEVECTLPAPPKGNGGEVAAWGESGKDAIMMAKFRRLLSRTSESKRRLLLQVAQKMASTAAVQNELKSDAELCERGDPLRQ